MATTFKALFEEAEKDDAFWSEWPTQDFAEELLRRMALSGMTRADLARKLGVSQPYITKALRGNANLTVRSLSKLAKAVESVVRLHLAPIGSYTVHFDVLEGMNGNTVAASSNTASHLEFGGARPVRASWTPVIDSASVVGSR
jgi:transcriptional regulator with XRE-family HTH domain